MTSKKSPFDAVITHPEFGTVYMYNVRLRNGYVIGDVAEEIGGYNMPPGSHTVYNTWNFPIGCIKEVRRNPLHKDNY